MEFNDFGIDLDFTTHRRRVPSIDVLVSTADNKRVAEQLAHVIKTSTPPKEIIDEMMNYLASKFLARQFLISAIRDGEVYIKMFSTPEGNEYIKKFINEVIEVILQWSKKKSKKKKGNTDEPKF